MERSSSSHSVRSTRSTGCTEMTRLLSPHLDAPRDADAAVPSMTLGDSRSCSVLDGAFASWDVSGADGARSQPPLPNVPRPMGSSMARELSACSSLKNGGPSSGMAFSSRDSSMTDFSDITPEDPLFPDAPQCPQPLQPSVPHQQLAPWDVMSNQSRGYYFMPKEVVETRAALEKDAADTTARRNSILDRLTANAASNKDVADDVSERNSESGRSTSSRGRRSLNSRARSRPCRSKRIIEIVDPTSHVICGASDSTGPRQARKEDDLRAASERLSASLPVPSPDAKPRPRHGTNAAPDAAISCPVTFLDPEKHRSVLIVGSFSKWTQRIPLIEASPGVWSANLVLCPGVYSCKFIVDDVWTCDPKQERRRDPYGNENNVLRVGVFEASFCWDKTSAREVLLTGSFDGWQGKHKMSPGVGAQSAQGASVHSLKLPLPPGRYEVKFIVDGNWFIDVTLPYTSGFNQNNLIAVGKIFHEFRWDKTKASTVQLVGSFTEWKPVPMRQNADDGAWTLGMGLPPGELSYKFVVDQSNRWYDVDVDAEPDGYGSKNNVVYLGI
ncbi:Protein PTST, chloroplastic [Porphyridium purpureum]|uniref:Protein PTST, chloroplastic n=1 Tax=Porphyridium purpureum TaxID=35688 RepID=A0A5J4YUT1_PORPP|nr:Protein PTST, chloroplastic [Porphyridium purpureum]|eukprot:POR2033..scf209_3